MVKRLEQNRGIRFGRGGIYHGKTHPVGDILNQGEDQGKAGEKNDSDRFR